MTERGPTLELKAPGECSREGIDRFRGMVLEAGEVTAGGFDARIVRAEALAFLRIGRELIGVGALKNPYPNYVRKVFRNAHAKDVSSTFDLEIGWVVVAEAHRGHSHARQIVEALISRAGGRRIFATSVTARVPMHKGLMACGFERHGQEWQSQRRPDEKLYLFVHSGIIAG
ncbi:GNAT family N-acetyltransferase [Bradyrhizobium sp. CCBAU 53340]|uniref:GNAT family N-acetyltransferase n=1 Tax=Bradyrhizobium sp. CCBAU 53340 TaxID=1325112 RepID=UPI00188D2D59|nr:GNAT family N-acetyltransferase [Bradyrhizobium sp. CCBAU 53340]